MSSTAVAAPGRTRRAPQAQRWRDDIDGLRFLAIALVVAYHVWFGRVSGGVDVFLLISTFLLTESFLRRIERGDSLALPTFWVRRFARLLPAAAVTILAVIVFVAFVMPPSTWSPLWSQAWASLFYVENWQLAAASVDYYARDAALPSPLQHFWSLSMQGQVFVLWPLLLACVDFVSRRTAARPRVVAAWTFALVFALSLAYSVVSTAQRQEFAYFDTGTRLWEFALGSLVAIAAPSIRPGRVWGAVLGWAGLAGLISCGFVFDVGAGFPGYIALWPTLSAVAIILAGQSRRPGPVTRRLGSAPMRRAGTIAYSLYLVHWPILIGFIAYTGSPRMDFVGGAVVVALSLAAAVMLHAIIERPLRAHPFPGSHRLTLVAAVLIVALPLAGWQVTERLRAALGQTLSNPGAAVLMPGANIKLDEDAQRIPLGSALDAEWVALREPCEGDVRPTAAAVRATCAQLSAEASDAPLVLVIGDSHAEQWMGALIPLAETHGWRMVSVLKGGCSLGRGEIAPLDGDCREWQRATIGYAERLRADVVVMMGTKAEAEGPGERVPRGLAREVDRIVKSGSDVVLIRDNPRFDHDMFQCLEQHGRDAPQCSGDRDGLLASENPALELASDAVHVVDLTDYLCPDGVCLPEIGNVAVYLDHNHLTGTYARTLAPAMEEALSGIPALGLD